MTVIGVPAEAIRAPLTVISNPPAMEAALAWYRTHLRHRLVGPTKVP
jgi:hypothetical protein